MLFLVYQAHRSPRSGVLGPATVIMGCDPLIQIFGNAGVKAMVWTAHHIGVPGGGVFHWFPVLEGISQGRQMAAAMSPDNKQIHIISQLLLKCYKHPPKSRFDTKYSSFWSGSYWADDQYREITPIYFHSMLWCATIISCHQYPSSGWPARRLNHEVEAWHKLYLFT